MAISVQVAARFAAGMIIAGAGLGADGAWAADVTGSADYPLIPRYQGSEIIDYAPPTYDTYHLFIEPATDYGGLDVNLQHTLPLEGTITQITYRLPENRSPLEVMRNYEMALDQLGFETLFQCETGGCGGRNFNHAAVPYTLMLGDNYADQRFLSARRREGDSEIYVSLYVTRNTTGGGPNAGRTFAKLDVIESAAMDVNMQVVDQTVMAEELAAAGHVALHAILFEFDSAVLRPEAGDQLREMADYLTAQADRMFLVVGHTDNQGDIDYNVRLSQERAAAVVAALASGYSIDPSRLVPVGVGMSAPIASNATEDGRAQNRRVELVLR